jgi:hypothetical protein
LRSRAEIPDPGSTNVRNVKSPHWRRWLGFESRCVVPFTRFSENETFASRKVKEGESTNELFVPHAFSLGMRVSIAMRIVEFQNPWCGTLSAVIHLALIGAAFPHRHLRPY